MNLIYVVIGLSIALQLKVQGRYDITVLARELPSDTQSRRFASPWAGANWASTTADLKQQSRDEATFKQWQKWHHVLPEGTLTEMPFTEYTHQMAENEQVHQWRSSFLPNYTVTQGDNEQVLTKYNGFTMHAPTFLSCLESELQSTHSSLFPVIKGSNDDEVHLPSPQVPVIFVRGEISSLSDVFDFVADAELVINATGLGSKELKDVLDTAVYPIRGQTVIIEPSKEFQQNPRCVMKGPKNGNFGVEKSSPEDQEFTYVIPRARSGQVICGGCAIPHDWGTEVDVELSKRILQRCIQVAPDLLDKGVDPSSEEAWKTIKVVGHGVGLRPSRRGGLRLEKECLATSEKRSFHVLHAYGAGGGGYQSGYGTSIEALALVEEHFRARSG
ncbi:hypothetical protein CBS101457_000893 [Exobasidium rhododendri]|nr:hypothetical protein CBS101457_000893 [Exobasidium rhododendri]